MNKENFDVNLVLKELLIKWFDKKLFLKNDDKNILLEIVNKYFYNVVLFYEINKAIVQKEEFYSNDNLKLYINNKTAILNFDEEKIEIEISKLREVIVGMISILEDILPLGSVVDLKKEYLKNHMKVDNIENIRIVITHRFLYSKDSTAYFPYAGVVYPVGTLKRNEVINFTPPLIEKVVYKGYSDKQDEAYIYFMKKELILENTMYPYGLSIN